MKKYLLAFAIMICGLAVFTSCDARKQDAPKRAKYVFYFITDGTGVNTILGHEMLQYEIDHRPAEGSSDGCWGRHSLTMTTKFPVYGVSSTYSYDSGVTDSAASGTALSSGVKTRNGMIGEGPDSTAITSIAVWAHEAGVPVGVASSVCINHATPASFFAHQDSRKSYYEIGAQLPNYGFEFFGGSDIRDADKYDSLPTCYEIAERAGYTLARGVEEYHAKADEADRIVVMQHEAESNNGINGRDALPYYIDAEDGQLTVIDILRAEIDFLYNKKGGEEKGFFIMNEIGGRVDQGCHADDAATAFREVAIVDSCMRIAYEFYLEHPDETLIVLTADHETGGLVLSRPNSYAHDLRLLTNQRASKDVISHELRELRRQTGNKVTWEQAADVLRRYLGFWDTVQLSDKEEKKLREVYRDSFVGKQPDLKGEYAWFQPLAHEAIQILDLKAGITWTTGGHSAGLVPAIACGVGAEQFIGQNDNAEFPIKIARAAGYAVPAVNQPK